MTELFGRLAPGVDLDAARAELRAVHAAHRQGASRGVSGAGRLPDRCGQPARPDHLAGANDPAGAARGLGAGLHRRLLERREPDPGALGAARRRAGDSRGAGRQHRARCDGRCSPRACCSAAPARCSRGSSRGRWWPSWRATPRAFRFARNDVTVDASLLWVGVGLASRRPCCWRSCRGCRPRTAPTVSGLSNGGVRITSGTNRRLRLFAVTQIARLVRAARRRRHADDDAVRAAAAADRVHAATCSR